MSATTTAGKNTQRQRLEAREERIITAATQVFGSMGADGATMAAIAKQAEVAEGTLYLYYRNKSDLLAVVVEQFWADLTEGAVAVVDTSLPALEQLAQLANYHLEAVMKQFDLVALTYRARLRHGEPEQQLPKIRGYVRVFDRIIERGIDRGELNAELPLWQVRDVFYGTLEYSARTLLLHEAPYDPTVAEQLIRLFACYAMKSEEPTAGSLNARLSGIEEKLDQLLGR